MRKLLLFELLWVSIPCAWAQVDRHMIPFDFAKALQIQPPPEEQFAYPVSVFIDASRDGEWQTTGGQAVWTYSVQVPDSTMLGFHAAYASLPAVASIRVAGANDTDADAAIYTASDVRDGQIWSRMRAGDTLTIQARMPVTAQSQFALIVDQLQAGFKDPWSTALGKAYANYLATQPPRASCQTVNYECVVSDENNLIADASVFITIQNTKACSATLLSDAAGDGKPYLLTARHCQVNGGPTDAPSVVVYYDAQSSCGDSLASAYSTKLTTSGATHQAQSEDEWLMLLDDNPPSPANAWLSGYDATLSAPAMVQSVHYANARAKQYYASGQPTLVQFILQELQGLLLDGWAFTPTQGMVAGGASGSIVANGNQRLIGSTSGIQSGTSCSVYAQEFAAPFNRAFHTILGNAVVVDGRRAVGAGEEVPATVTLTVNPKSIAVGGSAVLSWTSMNATSCFASGAWSGTVDRSGTFTVAPTTAGSYAYALSCVGVDGGIGPISSATLTVTPASGGTPAVSLNAANPKPAVGSTTVLNWSTANVDSCAASGAWSGAKSLNGSETVGPFAAAGTLTYTLSCTGPAGDASDTVSLLVQPDGTPTGGGGPGGGGSFDPLTILAYAAVAAQRRAQHRTKNAPR